MPFDLGSLPEMEFRYVFAVIVFIAGLILGYLVGRVNKRVFYAIGLDDAVEGTSIERMAREIGSSTVSLAARITSWIIYIIAALLALEVADLLNSTILWLELANILPAFIVAAIVLLLGVIAGDKAALIVSERLRSVKVPTVAILPRIVKYSIIYVAALIALAQIGIAVDALIVLLFAYVVAAILFTLVATRHLLTAGAAGIYLLLQQPYGIGDRIVIGDHEGIVQEMDVFVTHIEDDGQEYVVPNHLVFQQGVVLVRE